MAFDSSMINDEEVLAYIGIDYADTMVTTNINGMKAAAASFLNGAVGTSADATDPRAKQLALAVVADMYDNRGIVGGTKVSASVRKLIDDFSLQLILETRIAAEGGGPDA